MYIYSLLRKLVAKWIRGPKYECAWVLNHPVENSDRSKGELLCPIKQCVDVFYVKGQGILKYLFPHSLFLATEGQWSTLLYFLSKKTLHQLLNNYNSLMSGNEIFKRLLFLHISWHLTTMKSLLLALFLQLLYFL